MAYLSTNNRGAGVYAFEKGSISRGVSLEKFADCVLEIDAWIEFALGKGYENILLEGHSYGAEKIVYYMNAGRHKDRVNGVILLGFSDNVGAQRKYEQSIGKNYLQEAQELASKGEHERLLSDLFGLCGELPISAQTYLHCFTDHSANALALPLRQGGNLTYFQNIHVPNKSGYGNIHQRPRVSATEQDRSGVVTPPRSEGEGCSMCTKMLRCAQHDKTGFGRERS